MRANAGPSMERPSRRSVAGYRVVQIVQEVDGGCALVSGPDDTSLKPSPEQHRHGYRCHPSRQVTARSEDSRLDQDGALSIGIPANESFKRLHRTK